MAFIFKHGGFTTKPALTRSCAKDATVAPPPHLVKGHLYGLCNRTACQKPGADWYNHATQAYYCGACATLINRHNHADAMRLYGHALCTKVASQH